MELSALLTGVGLLLRFTTVYFAVIAIRWMFHKKEAWPEARPKTRFAVVIAARNEEQVIGRLVKSLLEQAYPRELFDIYVVPNNCEDDTAGAAFRAGANVLLCTEPVKQKGDALRQAFEQLRDENYDAYLVFDADNVADPQYLRKTNHAFCAGAKVVKGRQMALNPKESWVAGCYDLYFAGFDLFFNLPRANADLSVKLVGTGFAVHRSVLEQLGGWNTCTIAEDAEFAARCALENIPVCWAPEAVTYDEEPNQFGVSLHQRKRWCSGVIQVGKRMLPELMMFGKGRRTRDFCFFLLTAQLTPVSFLLLMAGRLLDADSLSLWKFLLAGGGYWLSCALLATLLSLICRPKERRNIRAIWMFPIFLLSWIPLQILALLHKTTVWRPIKHGSGNRDVDVRHGPAAARAGRLG